MTFFHTYCTQDQKTQGTSSKLHHNNQWLLQRTLWTGYCQIGAIISRDAIKLLQHHPLSISPLLLRSQRRLLLISCILYGLKIPPACEIFICCLWGLLRVRHSLGCWAGPAGLWFDLTCGACFDFFLLSFRNCFGLGIVSGTIKRNNKGFVSNTFHETIWWQLYEKEKLRH